jgi:hypothetical protein
MVMGITRTDTIVHIPITVITDRIGIMAPITGRIIGTAAIVTTATIATIVIIPTVIIGNELT